MATASIAHETHGANARPVTDSPGLPAYEATTSHPQGQVEAHPPAQTVQPTPFNAALHMHSNASTTSSLHSDDPRIATRDFGAAPAPALGPPPSISAESLLPPYTAAQHGSRKWMGRFASEEAYLAALRAFVEDKQFSGPQLDGKGRDVALTGFYGSMSGKDYVERQRVRSGGGEGKADGRGGGGGGGDVAAADGESVSRKRGLGEWMRRKRAGA